MGSGGFIISLAGYAPCSPGGGITFADSTSAAAGSRPSSGAYAVFDLLWLNGRDLRSLSLSQRKRRLAQFIPPGSSSLIVVPGFEQHGRELFQAAWQLDLEGIVAKRTGDPYGPETAWLKIKNPTYTEAEGRGELFERSRS